jgi:hypothetical protein
MNSTETSIPVSPAASTAEPQTGRPICVSPAFFGLTPPQMRVP